MKTELPILAFASSGAWDRWLAKNGASSEGVWLRLYKKASGKPTVAKDDAIDAALCHGWIDGQLGKGDDESWLIRFTPRRSKSIWSKVNVARVARLTEAGRMRPAGLAAVEAAKADGRWQAAYESNASAELPEDFLRLLKKDKKAFAFFQTLNKVNRYAIYYRLHTAKKQETREKRMQAFLVMLAKGEKLH